MTDEADVIIAGGGPAGLMLANELKRLGVEPLVFEELRRDEYIPPPRTNLTNARSMTLLRRLGISSDVRDADPRSDRWVDRAIFATRMNGHLLWSFDGPFDTAGVGDDAPEVAEWAPEFAITSPLRALADRSGVDVRYGKRLVGIEDRDNRVEVRVADVGDGAESVATGRYLAGCDGPASFVRRALGVRLEGMTNMAQNGSWLIRAPQLLEMVAGSIGFGSFYWLVNDDCPANVQPIDDELWQFHLLSVPAGFTGTDEEVKTLIRASAGAEIEVDLLNGGTWELNSVLAPSLQYGNAFLVGDAGHMISPFGGFGMNLGLLDASNLAWKLAGTLQGWGGAELLGSYSVERREANRQVMTIMEENGKVLGRELTRPGLEDDGPDGERVRTSLRDEILVEKEQEFDSRYAALGYSYSGSPIVADDGSSAPANDHPPYVASAHPGCLAPHLWDGNRSIYDRFGPGFTLLRFDPEVDAGPLERTARERGLPLDTVTVDGGPAAALYGQPLALIRPDQHVGWRGATVPDDPGAVLDLLRGAGLQRPRPDRAPRRSEEPTEGLVQ